MHTPDTKERLCWHGIKLETRFDILNLARTMQEMVFKGYGIIPQPECRLIGFKDYPLMR